MRELLGLTILVTLGSLAAGCSSESEESCAGDSDDCLQHVDHTASSCSAMASEQCGACLNLADDAGAAGTCPSSDVGFTPGITEWTDSSNLYRDNCDDGGDLLGAYEDGWSARGCAD